MSTLRELVVTVVVNMSFKTQQEPAGPVCAKRLHLRSRPCPAHEREPFSCSLIEFAFGSIDGDFDKVPIDVAAIV
jgi:hypothetical protein